MNINKITDFINEYKKHCESGDFIIVSKLGLEQALLSAWKLGFKEGTAKEIDGIEIKDAI